MEGYINIPLLSKCVRVKQPTSNFRFLSRTKEKCSITSDGRFKAKLIKNRLVSDGSPGNSLLLLYG